MLAADSYVGLAGVPVHAIFIQESDINACFDQQTGQLDLDTLKEKSLKFKRGQSTKFIKQSDSCIEAKFGSIELFLKLTRTKTLPVFEEKYRLMFYTQLGKEIYWTLSLPMVVTTGASQQCQCLASVMWQCFSTDVFSLPIQPTTDLPWKDIEGMLIAKMNNLPSNRSLTEENIQHLKQRLLGMISFQIKYDMARVALEQRTEYFRPILMKYCINPSGSLKKLYSNEIHCVPLRQEIALIKKENGPKGTFAATNTSSTILL